MSGLIYKITQKDTNKIYVGCTSNPAERWFNHTYKLLYGVHSCHSLQKDVGIFGLKSIDFDVLEFLPFSSKRGLIRYENYWIHHMVQAKRTLYNIRINPNYEKFNSFCHCYNPEYKDGLCQEHFFYQVVLPNGIKKDTFGKFRW